MLSGVSFRTNIAWSKIKIKIKKANLKPLQFVCCLFYITFIYLLFMLFYWLFVFIRNTYTILNLCFFLSFFRHSQSYIPQYICKMCMNEGYLGVPYNE